ncbi:BIRC6 (predicted) [Pycnogonum litorale]
MADSNEWYINEDGFLSVNDPSETIHYHPTLNAILVVTKEPAVKVIDVNSGSLLQKSNLSASHGSQIQGCYINKYDQMLFTDGHAIGLRKEYCGMLLLDTILQVPVNIVDEIVKIELPFAEALKLLKCLFSVHLPGVDAAEDFIKELDKKVFACQPSTKKNHKLAKWCTICLELPYCVVRTVCTSLVQELKRVNRLVPALAIASAINERLTSLLYNSNDERDLTANGAVDRNLMYSEATRKETFAKWPHMSYKWALPDQMAQAGFYHQPNSTGDDRALCFTCNVCLVCWEPTDEPWSEHERHSPSCPFVKGEYTQNVPLSVSYATSPAVLPGERMEQIHCLSSSSFPGLIATATRSGHIIIWNVRQQLKKELQFFIDPTDSLLLSKRLDHARYDDTHLKSSKQAWIEQVCEAKSVNIEEVSASSTPTADSSDSVLIDDVSVEELLLTLRPSRDVKIHKLCVLGSGNVCTSTSQPRPVLAVGLSIRQCDFGLTAVNSFSYGTSNIVQALNDANQSSSRDSPLDIMKVDKECPISNLFSRHQFHPFILIYDIDTQQNNGGNDAKPSCGSCDSVGNSLADTSSTSKSQPMHFRHGQRKNERRSYSR